MSLDTPRSGQAVSFGATARFGFRECFWEQFRLSVQLMPRCPAHIMTNIKWMNERTNKQTDKLLYHYWALSLACGATWTCEYVLLISFYFYRAKHYEYRVVFYSKSSVHPSVCLWRWRTLDMCWVNTKLNTQIISVGSSLLRATTLAI